MDAGLCMNKTVPRRARNDQEEPDKCKSVEASSRCGARPEGAPQAGIATQINHPLATPQEERVPCAMQVMS